MSWRDWGVNSGSRPQTRWRFGSALKRTVLLRRCLLDRHSACAERVPENLYSRAIVLRSDGLTADMELQGNRIVQPCRPGKGEFNRYSPGQGVGGLD